jgi:hypothetical protein
MSLRLGGASFSLQRRLQPASVASIGPFFNRALSPNAVEITGTVD